MLLVPLDKTNSLYLVAITLATFVSMMSTSSNYLSSIGKNLLTRRVEVNLKTLKVRQVPLNQGLTIHVTTMQAKCMCLVDMGVVATKGLLLMTFMYSIVKLQNGPNYRKQVALLPCLVEDIQQLYCLRKTNSLSMEDGARPANIVMSSYMISRTMLGLTLNSAMKHLGGDMQLLW